MTEESISLKSILSEAAALTKLKIKPLLLVFVCLWIIQIVVTIISDVVANNSLWLNLWNLVSWVINSYLTLGLIHFMLMLVDEDNVQFSTVLVKDLSELKHYFIATLLYTLMVVAGSVLLVVPGIILAIVYSLYGYLIVDEGLTFKESLAKSRDITRGKRLFLAWFGFVLILINVAGALLLFLPLLVTIPFSMVALALMYRELNPRQKKSVPAQPQSSTIPSVSSFAEAHPRPVNS